MSAVMASSPSPPAADTGVLELMIAVVEDWE